MSRTFNPSQVANPSHVAAVVAAVIALLDEWPVWEGTAAELRGQLANFIEEVPAVRALERLLAALGPELDRQGINLCRVAGPNHHTWALQLIHDPWPGS